MKTWDRRVTIDENEEKVTKSELHPDELKRRQNGDIVYPFWAKERLENEAATLRFIAERTSIPVPQCKLYTKDGIMHLETALIKNGVLLLEMNEESRLAAAAAVRK